MNSPTQALANTKIATNTAAQLQAVSMSDVPTEKLSHMVARTLIGGAIVLVGLALLGVLVVKPALDKSLTTTNLLVGLAAGLGVFAWGWLTVSSQLVGSPLQTVLGLFKGIWTTIRPGSSPGSS